MNRGPIVAVVLLILFVLVAGAASVVLLLINGLKNKPDASGQPSYVSPLSKKHQNDPDSEVKFVWKKGDTYTQVANSTPPLTSYGYPGFQAFNGNDATFFASPVITNTGEDMFDRLTVVPVMIERDSNHIVYEGEPIELKSFTNERWQMNGPIGPFSTANGQGFSINFPSYSWRVGTYATLAIASAHKIKVSDNIEFPWELYQSILNGQEKCIQKFEADPSVLKIELPNKMTPFLMAIGSGNIEVAKYLLKHGGSWSDRTTLGAGPLFFAAMSSKPEMLDFVYQHEKDLSAPVGLRKKSILQCAVETGFWPSVAWLINHGANVDQPSAVKETPVMIAAINMNYVMLRTLITAGADFHIRSYYGDDLYAFCYDNLDCRELLYESGLSLDAENPQTGLTPIQSAVKYQNYLAMYWCLEHGQTLEKKNSKGLNCWDYALQSNT